MSMEKTVHCYDYVNHPYKEVRDALSGDPTAIFHNATKAAALRAESIASELRINVSGISIGTDIDIVVKSIEETPKKVMSPAVTRIKLMWASSKMPRLFPFMEGELSIYKLTSTETQLDFKGNYAVPLGAVGIVMDAMVGHRIAEASVDHFIKDVARYLRSELSES